MTAIRITLGDPADRDAMMLDLANFAAARHEGEAVFTAYDPATGRPARVEMRPHGERAIDIEVVREFAQTERERHLDILRSVR